jgi:hypothetical protein
MKERTPAQRSRQQYRDRGGRYAETFRCYLCDRNAGEAYQSDRRTDTTDTAGNEWGDVALCLCARCAKGLEALGDAEAFDVAMGRVPRPWIRQRKAGAG